MTDPVPKPERAAEDQGAPPRTPRWVIVSAIGVVVVALVLVVVMALSGGEHGPGLHGGASAPPGVVAPVVQLEAGYS